MKKVSFPLPLQKCFENEVAESPLNGYLGNSIDLLWLYKQFIVSNFIHKKGDDPTFQRFFSISEIHCERFMEACNPVMTYITDNEDLFQKPYIGILAQNDKDHCWSCFVAANAGGGQIQSSGGYPDACGKVHYKPFPKDTEDQGRLQCSFFLTLAYLVLTPVNPSGKRKKPKEAWKGEVVMPCFQTMGEFESYFAKGKAILVMTTKQTRTQK